MNALELALEKQRLQLESASQRVALAQHSVGLLPLFEVAGRVRDGARWVTRHPEIVAGLLALLVAVRPGVRAAFLRWARRGFLAWRLWRDGSRWLNQPKRAG